MWDAYYVRLRLIISSARAGIEKSIREEIRDEFLSRWPESRDEVIDAYADAAVSFIEERLYAYGLSSIDRFLMAASRGVSPGDLASLEISIDWYECSPEKEEIDARIEKGLNLMRAADEIVEGLLREFGAFPDRTIIKAYDKAPAKNHLPDYALALALERFIRERVGEAF